MRDGPRSLRQKGGIAQHDAIYEVMRAHKEMRYMRRYITDEDIEALAQYYANMPH
jgi:cytochrome c553